MNLKSLQGVADTVSKIMNEKLHPNQQKLDVHEPEKDELTSDDFKKLRAGKKAEVKKEEVQQIQEYESKDGRFVHKARPGVYGGSAPEKHVVDTLQGPKKAELEKIEAEKKKKKFSEMVNSYKENGLKSISEWKIEEQASEEEFNAELKDQQEKSEGKKKQPNLAKGNVQAVKVEEESQPEETVEVELVVDGENGYAEAQIEERALTADESDKKEEIVKSMKKGMAGFKERYGDRAKEVMYATATARAKGD